VKQVPILMYHWFRTSEPSRSKSPQLEIAPELFAQQMARLYRAGYRTTSLENVLGGGQLPDRPVVVTFDDGTADFWDHARPALERHGFTATLFIVSGYVGGESSWDAALGEPARPLLTWDQIRALADAGHEIGSHTHRHRPLVDLSDEEAAEELTLSRSTLSEKLGREPKLFAYPRGFYEERHKQLVRAAGYAGACAVILNWGQLRRSDRYELKRMTIKGSESMLRFRLRVALSRRVRFEQAVATSEVRGR
jgi:peptidoglycan/xylan/chitin deacetylase (PgdA/CDA1 family)